MILLTLQLLSPLFAVFYLIMTYQLAYKTRNIINDSLSICSIGSITDGIAIQAGLLIMTIPVIAQKIASGGMAGLGDMVGGAIHQMQGTASQLTTQTVTGNYNYGNGSFKNSSYNRYRCSKKLWKTYRN
jgi:conjugal transfer mating pair stabilization protein TraG